MSADLVWQVIRNNSCFLRRQRGINKLFSTEKFNLKGRNSRRYNGLVNAKAIDVSAAADGKGIVLSTKTKSLNKPAKSTNAQTIKNADRALTATKKVAQHQGLARYSKLAQRRAAVILRSQRPRTQKNVKKTEA